MKQAGGGERALIEIGGLRQGEDGVVRIKLIQDGLKLNIAASCVNGGIHISTNVTVYQGDVSLPSMRRDSPSGM